MATQLQPQHPELVPEEQEELHSADGHAADHHSAATIEPTTRLSILGAVKRDRKALFAAALIVVLVVGTAGWMYLSSYESTDDAQVDGHLNPISARISGTILRVNPDVQDSHFVQAGTVLAEIDPADFQAERDRAQAEYDRLQAGSVAAEQDIAVTSSGSNGRLDLAHAAISEA